MALNPSSTAVLGTTPMTESSGRLTHLVADDEAAHLLHGLRPRAVCGAAFVPAGLTIPTAPLCSCCRTTKTAAPARPAHRSVLRRFLEDVLTIPTTRPPHHRDRRSRARPSPPNFSPTLPPRTPAFATATVTVPAVALTLLLAAAMTDAKTGLLTHAAWQRTAAQTVTAAARPRPDTRSRRWGLMMLDLDHFADLNTRYGHPAADDVLAHVAATLRRATGPDAVIGRFGGDEFTILLPVTNTTELHDRAEHIRRAIETLTVNAPGPTGPLRISGITATIGAALHQPGTGEHPAHHTGHEPPPALTALLWNADRALYDAKHAGRNTTRVRTITGDDI